MNRLLNINNYHYRRGGSDVVYLEHAKIFEEDGWATAYFSMKHPRNEDCEWSKFFVDEIEYGHSYSIPRQALNATRVIYSLDARRKLRQLLGQFRPDVAHLHCIYHHLSPSIVPLLRDEGVPVVMTAHDLKIACPAYKMLRGDGICERCKEGSYLEVVRGKCIRGSALASTLVALESAVHSMLGLYRSLDRIVVPSKFFLEKFVEWGWPRQKFSYIPNFVDAPTFKASYAPGNYFLYFGRLAPEKGVDTLIRAASDAGVSLKVVGTGPEVDRLKALASSAGLRTELLGYKSGEQLHDLIRGARAVVLPSEWYENAPMSVLESFALGKPVIGAEIGGIPELVIDGLTGWTYPSGDAVSLAKLLRDVSALSDSVVSELGRSAREFVEIGFSRTAYMQSMKTLYGSLSQ